MSVSPKESGFRFRIRATPMPTRSLAAAAVVAAALAVFAGDGHAAADGRRPVTFSEDVAPIIFTQCASCHRPGEAAPFPLTSYAEVRPMGRRIASVTASRTMPPWKAEGDYAFKDARRLTDVQIATLRQWVLDGMLEGDRGKLPPLPHFTQGWQLGKPDLIVSMPEPFEVPADGPDIYRTFVIPLNLDQDAWVRAIDFRPSARAVVHHSLFFVDTTGAARERDARDPGPGFAGGMGAGIGGRRRRGGAPGGDRDATAGIGGWAVGGRALQLPAGLAYFVPKGSDLLLSTHFHPSGEVQHERSTVGLYFAAAPPTESFAGIQLPPVFGVFSGIDIPAGDAAYTISDSFVLPVAVKAFGAGAHAHYLGKSFTLTATFPDGTKKTLIGIPDWDFSWQEQYLYTDFVPLPAGTRLDAVITYDNSAGNRRNPTRPPKRVTWGEQSTDEMGSVGLRVVAANPADLPRLQQAYAAHLREAMASAATRRLAERRQARARR
jgi:mono/diheme cytochrome c family protein